MTCDGSMNNTDSEDDLDDLSEVIKLREELAFSQLEPYDTDITHVILTKKNNQTVFKNNTVSQKYSKITLHKKEIHNESIGDEYEEFFSIQDLIKDNKTYTDCKITDTRHTTVLLPSEGVQLTKLAKYITPNITDLNVSKVLGLEIQTFTYLMSFLYFGVYLEDPAFYDADYLNLNILLDNNGGMEDKLEFLLKYFKYRIKSLNEEYANNHTLVVDDEDIDIDLYTKKILPLLLMLKNNLQ